VKEAAGAAKGRLTSPEFRREMGSHASESLQTDG
jgi:hypothetical protein